MLFWEETTTHWAEMGINRFIVSYFLFYSLQNAMLMFYFPHCGKLESLKPLSYILSQKEQEHFTSAAGALLASTKEKCT